MNRNFLGTTANENNTNDNYSTAFTMPVEDLGPIGGQKSKDYFYIQDIEKERNFVKQNSISLNDSIISKHVLFLGGIGTGKTNGINHLVDNILKNMKKEDKIIFFDTKGDYLKFYQENSNSNFVISNKENEHERIDKSINYVKWNMIKEITCDKKEFQEETGNEIARTLFDSYSNDTNPFFPDAARQLTHAILMAIPKTTLEPTNRDFKEILLPPEELNLETSVNKIIELLRIYPSLSWVTRNIDPKAEAQALGVLGQTSIMAGDLFSGKYGNEGNFSIREFIRDSNQEYNKGALFIEYDITAGQTLAPIYRILIDLAIKETVSRTRRKGNVYFILDEFGRLPDLQLIEAGINYGRELGARFILGTQTVGQIINAYGEETANSILSGFGTVFAFNLFDNKSREFVSGRYGSLRKFISFRASHSEGIKNQTVDGKLIEDWHISMLNVGEAIACIPNEHPRKVKFPIFRDN